MQLHCTPPYASIADVSPSSEKKISAHEMRALLDEADAAPVSVAPPMTERGALPSSHGLDYWAATIHTRDEGAWPALLGVPWEDGTVFDHGMRHYPRVWRYGSVAVGHGCDERNGVHLEMKGQGCREMESEGKIMRWADFAKKSLEAGAKQSRLDAYIDCRDGSITPDLVREKFKKGHVRCRSDRGRWHEEDRCGEEESRGATYEIGQRGSGSFLRVYDWAGRHCPKELSSNEREEWLREHGPHTRVELELRDEQAQRLVEILAERGFGWGLIAAFINSYVEFKEEYAKDHNGNRVPTWAPWLALMKTAEKVTTATNVVRKTVAETEYTLERMWGPMLLTLIAAHEGDLEWIKRIALRSRGRVGPKHRLMLDSYDRVREMGLVA